MFTKKDELETFLKTLKDSPTASIVAPTIERLERQVQQATSIIDKLWLSLLVQEVQIEETAKQRAKTEKMKQEEAELLAIEQLVKQLEDAMEGKREPEPVPEPERQWEPTESGEVSPIFQQMSLEESQPKEKEQKEQGQGQEQQKGEEEDELEEELEEQQPLDENGPVTETQVGELAEIIHQLETEFDDFEYGFEASAFEEMVRDQLEDLKKRGLLDHQDAASKRLSEEDRVVMKDLELELDKAEEWVTHVDQRLQQRNQEINAWKQAYTSAQYVIQAVSFNYLSIILLLMKTKSEARLNKTVATTNQLQENLESLTSNGPYVKAEEREVTQQVDQILNMVAEGVQGDWLVSMAQTREALRAQVDAAIEEQKRRIIDGLRAEEMVMWEAKKREIQLEIASSLTETYQWQKEVLKWLGLVGP
jgi:hypothetical protein